MSYEIHEICGLCIEGYITVDGIPTPCGTCNGTGKKVVGNIPDLETALAGLSDICKTTLEYCEKILSVVGKV